MKIVKLNEYDFDNFASKHKYRNIYQTSSYAKLMKNHGYDSEYLGFLNSTNNLVGASLILTKKFKFGFKFAYAPNGFLIDYNNHDFVEELTNKLKKLLFKQHFVFFRIDPLVICSKKDHKGNIIAYNPEIDNILNILNANNYKHKGFNKYFENTKARWNAILSLKTNTERLKEQLNKQTRNKINKANKLGVTIYKASEEDLETMYEFIKRKHNRKLKYYQDLFEAYQNNAELYLAKIDPYKYVKNSKEEYEKVSNLNYELSNKVKNNVKNIHIFEKTINKKIESDKNLGKAQLNLNKATFMYQTKPEGIIIGGAIIIKQEDTINLLIEGFNKKYKEYNPNYLLKWEIIKEYNKKGYNEFNLNAIAGEFKEKNKYSGLNEMKMGFSADAVEYIGEFDYIINPVIYKLFKNKVKKSTKN